MEKEQWLFSGLYKGSYYSGARIIRRQGKMLTLGLKGFDINIRIDRITEGKFFCWTDQWTKKVIEIKDGLYDPKPKIIQRCKFCGETTACECGEPYSTDQALNHIPTPD